MDYKKKYNEAQKWIESIYSELSHEQQMEAEAFFHELEESKDERIREEIIATIHLYYGKPLEDEAKEMIAWLEKQGKQEEPQVYETEDGEEITYSESEGYKVVKPKFHEGDWITCEELNTALIVNIDNDRYEVEFIDGNKGFPHIDYIDRLFHLWSIQDAKDGDVLIDEDVNVIGIFEGIEGMCWHSKFYYSNTTKEFYGIEYGGSHRKEFAKPATKEQRDTLMKVMADAGWEFDFEKKELKKISQRMVSAEAKEALYDKSAWSEGAYILLGGVRFLRFPHN